MERASSWRRLPVDVDSWSDAAGLTDLGGRRMSETSSPLSLVAAGLPVPGTRCRSRRSSTGPASWSTWLAPRMAVETVAEEVIRVCAPRRMRDDVALLVLRLVP